MRAIAKHMVWGRVKCWRRAASGLAAAGLAVSTAAYAGQSSSTASASVITPLSFVQVDNFDFGNIIAGTTAGTVTVTPFNVRTKTGGPTLAGGLVRAAVFGGFGTNNQNVQISLGSNTILITRQSGTQTILVDTFIIGSTPTAPLSTNPRVFRINSPTGLFTFPVGARLNIAANQVPGRYVGTFAVTLNYQ
jgi:Domain of unknown function (DUF4402)